MAASIESLTEKPFRNEEENTTISHNKRRSCPRCSAAPLFALESESACEMAAAASGRRRGAGVWLSSFLRYLALQRRQLTYAIIDWSKKCLAKVIGGNHRIESNEIIANRLEEKAARKSATKKESWLSRREIGISIQYGSLCRRMAAQHRRRLRSSPKETKAHEKYESVNIISKKYSSAKIVALIARRRGHQLIMKSVNWR